ncbi:glycosyltransferase [Patescibacteria group bacterium]|nr:glycosyltransferase [Patescibacteria group bacterium]
MSKKGPKITIVTCTYNSEKYLEKCLKSVEIQKYKNIQHIFNDSYSTDKTIEIINKYIEKYKDKYDIKFIQSPPKGVGNALNVATKHATGDIIHYLHSDDYYCDKNALKRVSNYFKKNPKIVWLTGNFFFEVKGKKIIIPHTPILKVAPKKALSVMNIIHHENTFMKTEMVRKYGGFNEKERIVVEYGLWLRLIRDHKPLIVNDEFTVFIIHKGSTSTGDLYQFSKAILRAFNTQHKEKVIPIIGSYGDAALYRKYKIVVNRVKKLNKLVELKDLINGNGHKKDY